MAIKIIEYNTYSISVCVYVYMYAHTYSTSYVLALMVQACKCGGDSEEEVEFFIIFTNIVRKKDKLRVQGRTVESFYVLQSIGEQSLFLCAPKLLYAQYSTL